MRTRYYLLVALFLSAVASASGSGVQGLKFTAIAVPGARATEASGINNLGQVAGAWEDATTGQGRGFVLGAGGYTSIDFPGALHTSASDINDNGDIVGTYQLADADGTLTEVHGYRLTAGGQFTTITFPGKLVTQAFGINNLGQIVGSYVDIDGGEIAGVHGFVLDAGRFTTIDFPIATSNPVVTFAVAITDGGDIVGGYNDDDPFQTRRGYVLRGGAFSRLDVPGSSMTDVFGANNAGELVGMYQDSRDGQFYSFLFNPKRGFSRIGAKGSPKRTGALTALDLNDSTQIVGTEYDGALRGFLASPPSKR